MNHTPGPWEPVYRDLAYDIIAEDQPTGFAMVACYPAEEEIANAYLIAAAPDLLEACKAALFLMETSEASVTLENDTYTDLETAINKAEGSES